MTTHQLPYQIVPQGENTSNHIATHLGRACQVKTEKDKMGTNKKFVFTVR